MHVAAIPAPVLFWVGYFLLAGGSFALWQPALGLLTVPALPLCAILHRVAHSREAGSRGVAHALWQMHTFGLFLLLFLALVALFFGLGVTCNDGPALDRLELIGNAYNSGVMNLYVALEQFWGIQELRWFTLGAILWAAAAQIWPLKRALQGMLALVAGSSPAELPTGRKWIAFFLAVAAHASMFLFMMPR